MPPAPPAPPLLSDSAAFKAILRLVASDAAVSARLGSPIAMASDSIEGSLNLSGRNDEDGVAFLTIPLSGPKGRALVQVHAQGKGAAWQLVELNVRPAR